MRFFFLAFTLLVSAGNAAASDKRLLWGDTHLHTSYSYDAGLVGNTLGPDEAYQFAKGKQVVSATGVPAKLVRPLDWLVVADHAETLGVPYENIRVLVGDTEASGFSAVTGGSRTTFATGMAVIQACEDVIAQCKERAARTRGVAGR